MKLLLRQRLVLLSIFTFLAINQVKGQFLMDMVDTSKQEGKGLLSVYKKFNYLNIGGYIQPQFQYIQEKGAKSYGGGDFNPNSNNRFMLRRGRIRFEYARFDQNQHPVVQFVFQFDGTEKGVFARDFWGRIFESRWQVFALTAGMFARPFGYELNLGSPDRESPERGRMSQILMKTERDLGAMVTYEPRKHQTFLQHFKWDAGFFNGQGLTNTIGDFDSYKDFISRMSIKPVLIRKNLFASAAGSYFNGGFMQNTASVYSMSEQNGKPYFKLDSSTSKIGAKLPRQYYGADMQIKWLHKKGSTEFRAEYWWGTQTATFFTSETPPVLLNEPAYIRKFNGAYFYLLHTFLLKHQLAIKLDWYDPNTDVKGTQIGQPSTSTGAADIKYSTLGFGYIYYMNDNLKWVFWYDVIKNENTQVPDFKSDKKDNLFTLRLQFRF